MTMSPIHPLDAELKDLWTHRSDLDNPGWARLYEIVTSTLMRYCPSELAGLHEEREVYVQDFFEDKVLRLDLLSRCDHVGALRLYYLHYLRDLLRSMQRRSKWEVAEKTDSDEDSGNSFDDVASKDTALEDPLTQLETAGFAVADVAASAANWLAKNEEWVRLFVALSNCPDAEISEPLIRLSKRKGVKSQAYKAAQLGFNWRGEDASGFAKTLIGRWIVSLGIEMVPENISLIHGALKILCFEALTWADQQEAAK